MVASAVETHGRDAGGTLHRLSRWETSLTSASAGAPTAAVELQLTDSAPALRIEQDVASFSGRIQAESMHMEDAASSGFDTLFRLGSRRLYAEWREPNITASWKTVLSVFMAGQYRGAMVDLFAGGKDWGCHSSTFYRASWALAVGSASVCNYGCPGFLISETNSTLLGHPLHGQSRMMCLPLRFHAEASEETVHSRVLVDPADPLLIHLQMRLDHGPNGPNYPNDWCTNWHVVGMSADITLGYGNMVVSRSD